ncbi:MAG TPA: DUF4142 domain-containing protein [Terriglobales bacterium]
MTKVKFAMLMTVCIAFFIASLCSAKSNPSTSSSDQMFVKEAAEGGMAEVELGQLALEKGSSDAVKQFGQRMVNDHGQANEKLKALASTKGIQLPAKPGAKDKATKARLSKMSGTSFDRAYMKDMLADHQKDIAAFQKESRSGSDPEIKQFASETLPTLQDHLKQAQGIGTGGGTQ